MSNQDLFAAELDEFVRLCLSMKIGSLSPVECYDYGSVKSVVVFRSPPFQAEFFSLVPGLGFPRAHRHPDVDAYEYIFNDDVPLIINGHNRLGTFSDLNLGDVGPAYRVRSIDWHGVGDVPNGGNFLSLQYWKDRSPSSVGLNWEGTPVSIAHRAMLRRSGSVWVKTLTGALA